MAPGIQICDLTTETPKESTLFDLFGAPKPANLSADQLRALDLVRTMTVDAGKPSLVPMDSGFQFREVSLSLATLASAGAIEFKEAGVELVFSQVGSSPGALLQLKAGGTLSVLAPGCRLKQPFEGFTILAAPGCATTGTARFVVIKNDGYRYEEPVTIPQGQAQSTLLGGVDSAGLLTFTSVNADTNPSGASPAGSFDASGWRAIDVYLDSGADGRTFDLVCWFQPRGSTQWFQNQGAFQSFGTTSGLTTTLRTQQFTMGLYGEAGKLYFSPVNMSAGTSVGVHAKGIV